MPLPLQWDDEEKALLRGIERLPCEARTLGQMVDVLFDRRYASTAEPKTDLYYMYRGVKRPGDEELFKKHGLRYDVTVTLARTLGREYNKTLGHYHPVPDGSRLAYPELYEVLSGALVFLIQTRVAGSGDVERVYLISAREGDKVMIPPGYGHIMINPGNETLVTANLVESTFKSEYEPIKAKQGGAYYLLDDGTVKSNPAYKDLPEPQRVLAEKFWGNKSVDFAKGKNVYASFLESPEKYSFLKNPDELESLVP
ncbi:hypothetical protein AUJ14_05295 [Candidatus Micrarchaeota archaeon CG1_02_55_22]|nr:MAG: hypothetical protein AUJ14_05295 [Candidatus Micrarchaeota archaeon CG1_02_55_22]